MNRLLFIDSDNHILSRNSVYFTEQGFTVDTVTHPLDALGLLDRFHYDCIILESRTADWCGFELCRTLRAVTPVPIIFLTEFADDASIEEGFLSGGNDYMKKPYSLRELELRILRRIRDYSALTDSSEPSPHKPTESRLVLLPDEKQAYMDSQSLFLTVNEFRILQFLYQNKGIPFSQEEIYKALWNECYNSHSIQTQITRIRKKIKALSPEKEYIRTQYGKGYVYTE